MTEHVWNICFFDVSLDHKKVMLFDFIRFGVTSPRLYALESYRLNFGCIPIFGQYNSLVPSSKLVALYVYYSLEFRLYFFHCLAFLVSSTNLCDTFFRRLRSSPAGQANREQSLIQKSAFAVKL